MKHLMKIEKRILSNSRTTDSRTASPDPTNVPKTNSRPQTSSVPMYVPKLFCDCLYLDLMLLNVNKTIVFACAF